MPEFLYLILVQLSLFSLGTALVAMGILVAKRPSFWWAYFGAKMCMFGIVGEILVLVLPHRVLDPGPLTYLYLLFVGGFGTSTIFISKDIIRRSYKVDP